MQCNQCGKSLARLISPDLKFTTKMGTFLMTQTKISFASDVHGSEKGFMKFIKASKFYEANVLILGGDLTGKVVIPIVEQFDGSYSTQEIKDRAEMLGPAKQGQYNELRRHFTEVVDGVNQPRFQRFRAMPMPNQQPPIAEVVLVQYDGVTPRIVEIAEDGAPTNYEGSGYQAIGSGDIFARSSLYGYKTHELTLDQSKVLAYMTIQKAIDIAALGLGHPIDIWTLAKKGGVATVERICEEKHKNALRDTANAISEAQALTTLSEHGEVSKRKWGRKQPPPAWQPHAQ